MRAVKVALADALRADPAVALLVPATSVYATERATVPTLPAVEVIAVTSERVGDGPMVKHELAVECTVSHPTEDGCDELLDGVVRAVRARLSDAEHSAHPIALSTGEAALVVLQATRWSISASSTSSVIRGASIALAVQVSE